MAVDIPAVTDIEPVPEFITDPGPAPPDQDPSVSIRQVSTRVVATVPTQIAVSAFRGAHYVLDPRTSTWNPQPKVTYAETELDYDTVAIRDHTGGGGTYNVTFAAPGDHVVRAFCTTTTGQVVQAAPITVHVVAAVPPAFTVVAPADNATVNLAENGQNVDVHLTIPGGPPVPFTVTLGWDGQTSAEKTNGPDYVKTIRLAPMPLGPRTISIGVADNDGVGSTRNVVVDGHDAALPLPVVTFPPPSANVIADGSGNATVSLQGIATDSQSGMVGGSASVSWALSQAGTRTAAQPGAAGDFRTWTAAVPVSGFGAHTIFVWATDQAGNTSAPAQLPIVLISSFVPATLEERLDERQYLSALLSFAQEQLNLPGPPPAPLDTPALVSVLGQPLDRLSQPLSAAADRGRAAVNQLRVPVELLRARIAETHAGPGPGAAGEAAYRATAYESLLAAAGTSYAELRLARGAAADERQRLAARLGLRLSPAAPDELDRLVLDGAALTEPVLETIFGLPDTTAADPLRVPPTPLLVTWRLAALSALWAEQDLHPNPPRAFGVLADPDVIGAADVVPDAAGQPVRTLLTARAATLTSYAASRRALIAGKTPAVALGLMLAWPPAALSIPLATLISKDAQGVDITADLDACGLTRAGFSWLRKAQSLAAKGPLTDAEWEDVIAVLTGAYKRRVLYPAWRAAETTFVLSPDFFVTGGDGPRTSPYRADPRARLGWQSVLRSRIAQRQDVIDANAQAVADAEQATLPLLRDALLADLAAGTTGDVGEQMSARYLVDMLANGSLRTTRIGQAIESVQSLLSAKRTGELATEHPAAAWVLKDAAAFGSAWLWMGEFGSWQSATMAFLFPERHLDPSTLATSSSLSPSTALLTLFQGVRDAGQFTAAAADQLAKAYLGTTPPFTYLDARRSVTHQNDLRTISAKTAEPQNREMFWAVPMLLAQRLQAAGDYPAALDWYWLLYPYDVPAPVSIYTAIGTETAFRPNLTFPPGWTAKLNPFTLVAGRPLPYTRYTLLSIIRCHIDFGDAEFGRETDESVAHARSLYLTALRLLGHPALQPQQPTNQGEPALPIPELDTLRARATAQLAKLRQGRNIAGMPRAQGSGAAAIRQPTPFRFKVLLDRAKQLAGQAVQMEAGYLAALEKYDDRSLRQFDAAKGIDLAGAQLSLAGARVQAAADAVTAATAQQTKAEVMKATYTDLIAAPQNRYENDLLHEFGRMRDIRDAISVVNTTIGVLQASAQASDLFGFVTSGGAKQVLAGGIAAATVARGGLELVQNGIEAQIQANQLKAGIEQRRRDWQVQQTAAEQDRLIAAAQVTTAVDQVAIAQQEEAVASLQYEQAVATLKFLNRQFTNADLYLWMSNTLGGVYRYFLQQATATARLAQAQLAFERAEPAQTLIRNDYWQSPAELTAAGAQPDRRGLTGAERLTEDLARLDGYAFASERRRLNLSQTFSLAQLMPVEFLDFRRTGTLSFATPMALFDADFPGHYLRLIRQVRTSVVGLVPPDHGIRATLYSTGISRVTTAQDGSFGDVVVRHDPTVVALTSPVNATGVFEMDVQSDMLLPFESGGVDTMWELQLAPAANPLDFSSIVDVLITIEYTALFDEEYRRQVVARLNADRERGADRVFSLARDFPDQWYDLNNPAGTGGRSVTLSLGRADFPLGVEDLATGALAVRLVSDQPVPDTTVTLTRGLTGGEAAATAGFASTRRGNAAAWIPLAGTDPAGDWQLTIGAGADPLFAAGAVDDVFLVVGWTGRGPAWAA